MLADKYGKERRDGEDAAYAARPGFEERLGERLKRVIKRRAQRALWLALAALGRATQTPVARTSTPRAGSPEVRRILVVRVDLLGDVVLSLPAVRALRRAYPAADIDMLVLHSTAGVLVGDPDITRVLSYDPNVWRRPLRLVRPATWRDALTLLRELRTAHYDLAVSISGDIGSILTRLSGARRRVGYAGEAYPFFMNAPVPGGRYRVHQHEVRYVQALARAAGGIVEPGDELLRLHVLPQAAERVAGILEQARTNTGARGPVVALHAGARNGQAKRWPPAHFATLVERLVDDLDALVIFTGAPNEDQIVRAIVRHTPKRVVNLVGKTSLPELVALLAASNLLITGDSGPMHIACAVRTPVVALHGPTDPELSGPTAPDAIVLRRTLWCSPCYDASATAECRFGNPVCMKELPPQLVYTAALRQLRRQGRTMPHLIGVRSNAPSASTS